MYRQNWDKQCFTYQLCMVRFKNWSLIIICRFWFKNSRDYLYSISVFFGMRGVKNLTKVDLYFEKMQIVSLKYKYSFSIFPFLMQFYLNSCGIFLWFMCFQMSTLGISLALMCINFRLYTVSTILQVVAIAIINFVLLWIMNCPP